MAGTDLDSPNMSRYCFCPTRVCVIIFKLLHWSYFSTLGSISSLPPTLDLILALPSSDSFLLRLLDDFRILHCLVFDKGTEHPILILTAFTWMACTFHHLLCFLFHERQDILCINNLLFTEWNLTAMINEVKPPCFGAGSDGLHFPVVKSFLLRELRKCVSWTSFFFSLLWSLPSSKWGCSAQLSKRVLCWQSHWVNHWHFPHDSAADKIIKGRKPSGFALLWGIFLLTLQVSVICYSGFPSPWLSQARSYCFLCSPSLSVLLLLGEWKAEAELLLTSWLCNLVAVEHKQNI